MKYAFVGGGTMGPVTPLIAVYQTLRARHADAAFCWLGTEAGPEKPVIQALDVPFFAIPVAKLPRYPSIRWFTWPKDIYRAYIEARRILLLERPDMVIGAGGFTAFPVAVAAKRLKIPVVLHQLDVLPGLTNRLVAPFASLITSSFAYDTSPFIGSNTVQAIATPVRFASDRPTREAAAQVFGLDPVKPIVLIVGGGTGAQALNDAFLAKQDTWFKEMQVIHVSGKGKKAAESSYEFLDAERMLAAYAAADVIVTRAGLGALSEIVAMQKPCVIVPIPSTQQEANAKAFADADAAIVLDQRDPGFASMLHACVLALVQRPVEAKKLVAQYQSVMTTDGGNAFADKLEQLGHSL